jgi:hypothetical protein
MVERMKLAGTTPLPKKADVSHQGYKVRSLVFKTALYSIQQFARCFFYSHFTLTNKNYLNTTAYIMLQLIIYLNKYVHV